ncbi:glycosyl transferase [Solibacillus isronensis]|uniref:glycosyl transferase n=1 Tax=Solibacillus isronensis TaxID=412383 RepID=UPI0039A2E905
MKNYIWYFILGSFLILISTPLSDSAVGFMYADKNLTGEYVPILNGFIHSFMLIGTLIFSIGLIKFIKITKA